MLHLCFVMLLLFMLTVHVLCNHFPVSCDSNLSLYLVHSSNGKSVSWSESGARPPPRGGNVWHRLSVHVRKQESGLNQTAVIRPLTNAPDPHSSELSTCDLGTDPHFSQDPHGTKPLYNVVEEDDEGESQRPLWTPPYTGEAPGLESNLDKPASYLPLHLKSCTTEHLQGAVVDTHCSYVPTLSAHTAKEAIPANEPLTLTTSQPPLARLKAMEEEASEDEDVNLLHSYIFDAKDEGEGRGEGGTDLTQSKPNLEDSLVLSPPSPFRDSVRSEESMNSSLVMESMLSNPSSFYTSSIPGDYAHSSSTL